MICPSRLLPDRDSHFKLIKGGASEENQPLLQTVVLGYQPDYRVIIDSQYLLRTWDYDLTVQINPCYDTYSAW